MKPPLTEEDIEAPDPWKKAKEDNKLNCHWLAGIIKDTGDKKEKGEVRLKAGGLFAKIDGLLQDRVEHSGTIVFESNVPEPDPLPEEEDAT